MARGNPKFLKTGAEHPCSKGVKQYTVDGVFLRSFGSIKEAAESVGICQQSISNALRKNSIAGHYIWKYADK